MSDIKEKTELEFKAIRAVLELNGFILRKQRDKLIYEVIHDESHKERGSIFLDASGAWTSSDLRINNAIEQILSIRI